MGVGERTPDGETPQLIGGGGGRWLTRFEHHSQGIRMQSNEYAPSWPEVYSNDLPFFLSSQLCDPVQEHARIRNYPVHIQKQTNFEGSCSPNIITHCIRGASLKFGVHPLGKKLEEKNGEKERTGVTE